MDATTLFTTKKSQRLLSIDAPRGFDFMLITGGGTLLEKLKGKNNLGWVERLVRQFEHIPWNRFISGVSLTFSLNKGLSGGLNKRDLYRKSFRRLVILILLSILYKSNPITFFDPSDIWVVSVLGLIIISGFITTLLYLNFSWSKRLKRVIDILLLYYAALFLIPIQGFGAGDLSPKCNLVGWFGCDFLAKRFIDGTYDKNELLTQLTALCLCVLGSIAGNNLKSEKKDTKKLQLLFFAGVTGIVSGFLWGMHFPINNYLWSSSFILLTRGIAFLCLTLFYFLIEVMKYKKWSPFFQVIGFNSLTNYLYFIKK